MSVFLKSELIDWLRLQFNVAEVSNQNIRSGIIDHMADHIIGTSERAMERAAKSARGVQHGDFDNNPAALMWARTKVQREIDKLKRWEKQDLGSGNVERAKTWRQHANLLRRQFTGGTHCGCAMGAFDERKARFTSVDWSDSSKRDDLDRETALGE